LSCPSLPIRFLDHVLYFVVRDLPQGTVLRAGWINRCIEATMETRDESLVESLVWVLRADVGQHGDFSRLATEMANESPLVAQALRKTGVRPQKGFLVIP